MSDQTSDRDHGLRLKKALLALQKMQARIDALERAAQEPIAIIGLGCRLPGDANDEAGLWRMLRDGIDAVTEVPPSRWSIDDVYDPDPDAPGKMYTRHAAFIRDIDRFDPHFFGMAPREAVKTDPQHRLLLEVAWEAFEAAGIPPDGLVESRTGVFVGISVSDYDGLLKRAGRSAIDAYHLTGACLNFAAGRLAYTLGLQGPAMAIDTACSSSLVAVHLACQSLRAGECTLALAGGVNAILSPEPSITASKARMLSPTGRAKTFDADADGFVRGEGCGVVVLRRLRDAVAQGDTIWAVIRGSAVNQDGPSSGLTVPNRLAQEAVIRDALARAGVQPADIDYVEAHGTGTALGDPIEIRALAAVLADGRPADRPLLVGSIKTNLGHLESAAGIAGLLKAVLALRHGHVPPHLHLKTLNPRVDWSQIPVKVPTTLVPWPAVDRPRLAGVSSFGGSGTNAHVVLEQAPVAIQESTKPTAPERPAHVLTLSARSESALRELARRLQPVTGGDASLADLCFSANTGRAQMPFRAAVTAVSCDDLARKLAAVGDGKDLPGIAGGRVPAHGKPRIAFLFTGQGSQYAGMGRELFETEPVFRAALERCAEVLRRSLDVPLIDLLYASTPADEARLNQTQYTQPALFAIEWALAEWWHSVGVDPSFVMGHSVGEYVAACRAQVFSLEEGLQLIAERGRLMQRLPGGGTMAAAFTSVARVEEVIRVRNLPVSIAAINGPENTVIAGDGPHVEAVRAALSDQGVKSKPLVVSHAFHSALLDPMLDPFERAAASVAYTPPRLPLISNITGRRASADLVSNAAYWRRHARQPVQFAAGVQTLRAEGCELFIEIGPAPTLIGMAAACVPGHGTWLPSLRTGQSDCRQLLASLGAAWVHGADVDWTAVDRGRSRRRISLPTYPFERQRYWIDSASAPDEVTASTRTGHPLIGGRLATPPMADAVFQAQWSVEALPYLDDHRVYNVMVAPATAAIEAIHAAGEQVLGAPAVQSENFEIKRPIVIPSAGALPVQIITSPDGDGRFICRIFSQAAEDGTGRGWTLHGSAMVRAASSSPEGPAAGALREARERIVQSIPVDAHYRDVERRGVAFGACFRGLASLYRGANEALGEVRIPQALAGDVDAYRIHPAVLDACFQVTAVLLEAPEAERVTYVPVAIERAWFAQRSACHLWSHVVQRSVDIVRGTVVVDVQIFDTGGDSIGRISGLTLQRTDRASLLGASEAPAPSWLYSVEWRPAPRAARSGGDSAVVDTLSLAHDIQLRHDARGTDPELVAYDDRLPELNDLSTIYMERALRSLGWGPRLGERVTVRTLASQLGILEQHQRFLGRMLQLFEEDGWLARTDDGWIVCSEPQDRTPEPLRTRLGDSAECAAELSVISHVGDSLADALCGACDPLQLLFPDGSVARIERMYQQSLLFRTYNALLEETLTSVISRAPAGRIVRILEVGGGTGGTTMRLLPRLPADRVEYTFTDVSPLFLTLAREKFSAYPFVRYAVLDIEKDPASQRQPSHHFDIVVAANVLHATADLRQTLRHVGMLLAPSGLLALLEGVKPLRAADLIVGLTEGWWKFADADLRESHALLPADRWVELLHDSGYLDPVLMPDRTTVTGGLAHHAVVLARGAGSGEAHRGAAERDAPHWMILGDDGDLGERLARELEAQGCRTTMVRHGDAFGETEPNRFCVAPDAPGQFVRVLDSACRAAGALTGVVHLWSLDIVSPQSPADPQLADGQLLGVGSAVHLVQSLSGAPDAGDPRLWLVTRGSQAADAGTPLAIGQAPIWGVGATISQEHPQLRCVRVDLDPATTADSIEALCAELLSPDSEDEVALRNGIRLVRRLAAVRGEDTPVESAAAPTQLEVTTPGTLDGIAFRPLVRRIPAAGEVEIEVHATGLNFRDVLRALGVYPGDTGEPLGIECAGRVVSVGPGAEGCNVGDDVVAMTPNAFGTYVIARSELVAVRPAGLSAEQAATIPSAFVTAHHALHDLAKLQRGERVLIHAAAGGVGLAAVQIAQLAGAEVFATAGSSNKRAYLESLGVTHVFDSRSTGFAEEVMARTDGAGIDVVLNSLSGEMISSTFACLHAAGRFVEIGRRDIWDARQAAAVRPNASYFVVDLAATVTGDPAIGGAILRQVLRAFQAGSLAPLPVTAFRSEQVVDAFRYLAQARHIGKVIVSRRGARTAGPISFEPAATYLIVGGLSGLGLRVGQWMVEAGARRLVLMGRGAPGDDARLAIAAMQRAGAVIDVVQGDVANPDDLQRALSSVDGTGAPLRGVVQCAGVLDDGVLTQQDWSRFTRVMAPKVTGSWNLALLAREHRLDFFVIFSSAVSVLGSAGQGNHAAACAFEDALASHLAQQGLPALSINWGPWSDIGSIVRQDVGRLKGSGFTPIAPDRGIAMLERMLREPRPQAVAMQVDWPTYIESRAGLSPPLLAEVVAQRPAPKGRRQPDLLTDLAALPVAERLARLRAHVRKQIVAVLGLDPAFVLEPQQGLRDLGIDSLMSIELKNRLQTSVGLTLPSTLVFDYPTPAALADFIAEQLFASDEPPARPDVAETERAEERAREVAALDQLSSEEAEALLLQELSSVQQGHAG